MEALPSDLVAAYASLFVHQWRGYAVQQADGSYWRVPDLLSLPLLSAHLSGQWTLGTYLLDGASTCAFAVFDADSVNGLARLMALCDELLAQGIPTLLEASRRGGHLWLHLSEPASAHLVRAWLLPYALAWEVELYPKQDTLAPGGSGSLIRLPLGVHRRSRGWYPFLARSRSGEWRPVGETVGECCLWALEHIERVAVPDDIEVFPVETMAAAAPPVRSSVPDQWGCGSIRAWCRAQNIVAVIGRYVALDHRGVGFCPFKEHHHRGDQRPSFQVFGGSDPHWYCYTWRRAGDLFDFLCLYYGLSPQEAWERLRAGVLL